MSTLAVVEEILRSVGRPVSVREIVDAAGERLPTCSKTPDTVVARDLSMDIKRLGEDSKFVRTSPGRYTVRALVASSSEGADIISASQTGSRAGTRPVSRPGTESEQTPAPALLSQG
jgi:hypothetical protein